MQLILDLTLYLYQNRPIGDFLISQINFYLILTKGKSIKTFSSKGKKKIIRLSKTFIEWNKCLMRIALLYFCNLLLSITL